MPHPAPSHTVDYLIRPRDLAARLGISLATLWRYRHRPDFPPPVRLSPQAIAWRCADINRWLDAHLDSPLARERF